MDKELISSLLKVEIAANVKKGMPLKEAGEAAAKKLEDDMQQAKFETYCSEHNC